MKRYVKKLIRISVFVLAFAASLIVFANITMPKRYDYGSTWGCYLEEPSDSIDVLFFGSSLVYCNVNPSVIYENSGITSYVMAGPEQTIPITYYYIREAVRTQTPKTIFLEATGMFYEEYQDYTKVNIGYMPWSVNRIRATLEAAEGSEKLGLLFPLYNYHGRWSSLTLSDLKTGILGYEKDMLAGYTFLDKIEPQTGPWARGEVLDRETYSNNLEYMKMIADFCKKEGISLIVYLSPTYSVLSQGNLEMLKTDLSEISGVTYMDIHDKFDYGIDQDTDFFDLMHFNCLGAEKFSTYLASLIQSFDMKATENEDVELWWSRVANFLKLKGQSGISSKSDPEPVETPADTPVLDTIETEYETLISLVRSGAYAEAITFYDGSLALKEGYKKAGLYYTYARALKYHCEADADSEAVQLLRSHIDTDFARTILYDPVEPYMRTSYGATWGSYLKEPEDSIDVMFFGSSLIYCDIVPPVIYSGSEITSYVMGGPEQTIPITYYYIKEALKTQNPKIIFVEVTGMFYEKYYSSTKANVEFMPKSINRLAATFEAIQPELWDKLLFSVYNYEDNEGSDTDTDSMYAIDDLAGYTFLSKIEPQTEWVYRPIDFDQQEYDLNLSYLEQISSYCMKESIQLVYFIAPSFSRIQPVYIDMLASDINDIGYGEFFDHNVLYDESNIDKDKCFFDILHFNCYGARNYSAFLGRLLMEQYSLTASEGTQQALWRNRVDAFNNMMPR